MLLKGMTLVYNIDSSIDTYNYPMVDAAGKVKKKTILRCPDNGASSLPANAAWTFGGICFGH